MCSSTVFNVLTVPGEPQPAPGLRLARRCRATGTSVSLYDSAREGFPSDAADDEAGRWLLYCDHGHSANFETLREAQQSLSHPEDWCARCIEIDDFWKDMENEDDGRGPDCVDDEWVLVDGWTFHVRCPAKGCKGVTP